MAARPLSPSLPAPNQVPATACDNLETENATTATAVDANSAKDDNGPASVEVAAVEGGNDEEVVVKTEEAETMLDTSRTRSGKKLTASKQKAKKQRAKKSAAVTGKAKLSVGKGHPAATSSTAATSAAIVPAPEAADPPTTTTRAVSDTRKRRRVSTDVDGTTAQTSTIPRIQDPVVAPTLPVTPTQRAGAAVISISSSPIVDDLHDPPAATTSDMEMDDVVMLEGDEIPLSTGQIRMFYGLHPTYTADEYRPRPIFAAPGCLSGPGVPGAQPPRVRQAPGATYMVQRFLEEQSQQETSPYVLVREDFAGGNIEDLYTPATSPRLAYAKIPVGPPPSREPSAAFNLSADMNPFLGRQGDPLSPALYTPKVHNAPLSSLDKGKAPQRNATAGPSNASRDVDPATYQRPPPIVPPTFSHPHPVHYAPGPFPNFPPAPVTPIFPTEPTIHHFLPIPPTEPAIPAEPAFPTGPIAPLPQAHGFSAPGAMTRPPPGGWLPLQGDDFFWPYGNMEPSQLAVWTTDPEPCVLLHFLGRSGNDPGNHGRVTMAHTILRKVYDIRSASITQPIAANPQPAPNAYPTFYRVSDITIPQRDALLRDQWISTTDGTIGIIAAPHEPPTFMGGFRYPGRLARTSSNEDIARGFQDGFESEDLGPYITALW
ncbi:uncharacterized protein B0H18DRAFT_1118259 [Fomitopsis serialis]|uniref:uncharacterized protein n=1 Tax=Fomitopsis serialis TaxID=139415 RepID=UPI0020077622|nr:uncharacterized protein B0H18DRAFT_1118259 [Neoantrodia serialis]KAH9927730.1 hypothetical protein B0H18DRAFT_1118259 [Neoantrodia serialis]